MISYALLCEMLWLQANGKVHGQFKSSIVISVVLYKTNRNCWCFDCRVCFFYRSLWIVRFVRIKVNFSVYKITIIAIHDSLFWRWYFIAFSLHHEKKRHSISKRRNRFDFDESRFDLYSKLLPSDFARNRATNVCMCFFFSLLCASLLCWIATKMK